MRSIQLVGFLIAVFAVLLGCQLLYPVEAGTPLSAKSGSGIGLIFLVTPALALSALMLIPSSIALGSFNFRKRSHFQGKFWYGLWAVNCIVSVAFLVVIVYVGYIWLAASFSN